MPPNLLSVGLCHGDGQTFRVAREESRSAGLVPASRTNPQVAFFFWRVAFQRSGSGSGRD